MKYIIFLLITNILVAMEPDDHQPTSPRPFESPRRSISEDNVRGQSPIERVKRRSNTSPIKPRDIPELLLKRANSKKMETVQDLENLIQSLEGIQDSDENVRSKITNLKIQLALIQKDINPADSPREETKFPRRISGTNLRRKSLGALFGVTDLETDKK